MQLPKNHFKARLQSGNPQIGLWVGLADSNCAEALAGCGFDWLLLDAEHAPNNVRTILDQLRAIAPYPVQPVVRPVNDDTALIKQYLDIGAQTLLVPMIDTAEQAADVVRAMLYPPSGIRGVGAALARASRWNQIPDYIRTANAEMCVLVQAETPAALNNLSAIAQTDGVDGVFFGPADLSASMGYPGQPNHPDVKQAITLGIETVRACGKAAGILMADPEAARAYLQAGANFVAVGVDVSLLVKSARALATEFGRNTAPSAPSSSSVY
ncbi:MAG: 4-hydroxy-2-oxoheptanedioate aldolase [Alcaligenaceae bacterium]|nr:4-hydroxy-2-oxoheptanedioate aldolase [Alcaligenaceae bacterium]